MEILLVVFLNVTFLVVIYITLSRKVARVESRSLPEDLQVEMDTIITTFNRTADRNIDLLDDRVRSLEPLVNRGERLLDQLEGLVRRAEALSKLRDKIQPSESALEVGTPLAPSPLAGQAAAAAYRSESLQPEDAKPRQSRDSKKPAKAKRRAKKTIDENIREMTEAGSDAGEIARTLGIPREEVLLKQKMARLSG
jgi:hypothetical protein